MNCNHISTVTRSSEPLCTYLRLCIVNEPRKITMHLLLWRHSKTRQVLKNAAVSPLHFDCKKSAARTLLLVHTTFTTLCRHGEERSKKHAPCFTSSDPQIQMWLTEPHASPCRNSSPRLGCRKMCSAVPVLQWKPHNPMPSCVLL